MLRALAVAFRLCRGYRLTPWRSPYLRWRIETWSGVNAESFTAGQFFGYVWTNRRDLLNYLRWAGANIRE